MSNVYIYAISGCRSADTALLNSKLGVFLITYSLLRLKRQDLFCVKQEACILYWWATLLFPSWWSVAAFLQHPPPPRKPLSVVADLIVRPAGAVPELCCCGAPLGTAASAAQCWGSAGHQRTPQLQVQMRCHTGFSRTWRLQAMFCILQNTAPHLKPVQWVTRYWKKSLVLSCL